MSRRPLREDLVMQACLEVYGLVRHERWLADRALEHVLRNKTTLYSTERKAATERLYSLLKRQRLIDHLLPKAFRDLAKRSPTQVDLLRFAADRVLGGEAPSMVVDALALPGEWAARLKELTNPALVGDLKPSQRLAVEGSLADGLADRLVSELGADEAKTAVEAFSVRAPLMVRANTLKTSREALAKVLNEAGVRTKPTTYSPLGLVLETRVNVFSLKAFKDGLFEVQDEGSQVLGMLADAPGTRIIDACAGAGGKTLQLAAQMKNKGDLFALDIDEKRLGELKSRARRAGVHNVRVSRIPPEGAEADAAVKHLVGTADRVLIDAPCTGTGTLRRKPDARYRFDDAFLEQHTQRQATLLERFAALAKPKGRVIYGTCSILRAENEDIVSAFLKKHPEFQQLDAAQWVPAELVHEKALRLWTHRHGTDGFFGTVLERAR